MRSLSSREKEVLELVMQGKSNKQIAFALGISIRTVEFHLKNIYTKYQVASRIELVLYLVKTPGEEPQQGLGYSTVERRGKMQETGDSFVLLKERLKITFKRFLQIGKEVKMKKRWLFYFLAGLLFGALYWHYFSITAKLFNDLGTTVTTGLFVLALLTYFGVWLIPAIVPAVIELRRSASSKRSVLAVVVVFVSAVLGYYLNYLTMLALVGLPNLEFLLVLQPHSPTLWQDWAGMFPQLILFKFIKWAIAGAIIGAAMGLITNVFNTARIARRHKMLPA